MSINAKRAKISGTFVAIRSRPTLIIAAFAKFFRKGNNLVAFCYLKHNVRSTIDFERIKYLQFTVICYAVRAERSRTIFTKLDCPSTVLTALALDA